MSTDLRSWSRTAVVTAAVVGLGIGVAGTAVVVGVTDGEPGTRVETGPITLVAYDTCDSALAELKAAALPHVGPYGLGGDFGVAAGGDEAVSANGGQAQGDAAPPLAAPGEGRDLSGGAREQRSAPDAEQSTGGPGQPGHSGTNTHESGVDEPDLVKTDGRRIVTATGDGTVRVVDVASRRQTASLPVAAGYPSQLLLDGDRALVLISGGMGTASARPMPVPDGAPPADTPSVETPSGGAPPIDSPPIDTPPAPGGYGSRLVLLDLTGAGKVLGTLEVDGTYLDARQVDSVARVVVRSTPSLEFPHPTGMTDLELTDRNRGIVERSSIQDWLPKYTLDTGGRRSAGTLLDCTEVSHPERYTGSALLTVLTVDLRAALTTGDPIGIAADGNTVYGTGTNLYVADDHFAHGVAGFVPDQRSTPEGGQRTEVYQFDISGPGKPVHVASGGVPGGLLNQYSLSEHEGHLRIATTTGAVESSSAVSVLTRRGDQLAVVGSVGGLGKGERIYSVRFLGDVGYVVTFRQTDPLYTVDLSDPARPRVTGELKITGYSAYLHPVGEGRLLGVGQEATEEGMTTGTQVSLFDTSDPAGAERIGQFHLPGGYSEVEHDPHAFLYWPAEDLVVLPVNGAVVARDGTGRDGVPRAGVLVLRLSGNRLDEVGLVTHLDDRFGPHGLAPRRALVIGTELWTVSDAGVMANDLDTLAQLAWVPFS